MNTPPRKLPAADPGPPPRIPGDIVLESNERVLVATRPLLLWEPLMLLWLVLLGFALYGLVARDLFIGGIAAVAFVLVSLILFFAWVPWRAKWYVVTDRRVIARWGVLNRKQAAELLDRIQDASLSRPFPLSMIRDYGIVTLETAGEHAEETISGGLDELRMAGAGRFYRALTEALTPNR
jgi:membrane protein YdbS with pleckstrin-like domain